MTASQAPRGIVLPVVLVILVVLELLAAGTLALAYQESAHARHRAHLQRAALAARTGTSRVASAWGGSSYQQVPIGTAVPSMTGTIDPFTSFSASVERLAGDLFLIRTEGRSGLGGTESRSGTAFLMAAHDITRVAAQFPGAAGFAGPVRLSGAANIDGHAADDVPAGWPADQCGSWVVPQTPSAGLTLAPGATLEAAGTTRIAGDPALQNELLLAEPETFARLGTITLPTLAAIADRTESGVVLLEPSAGPQGCDPSAPGNWGAPRDPSHPCAGYFPVVYSPGDLTISSGAGQGVLVVDGNLTLGQGVEFFGLALVRGRLIAGPGAALNGAALIGSAHGVSMLDGARIRRCNCAIGRALTLSPALNLPVARRGRSWVPVF